MGKRSRSKREAHAAQPERPAVTRSELRTQDSGLARAIGVALAIAVVVIYAQVRTHDFINFDDPDYVVTNPNVSTGLTAANVAWAFTHYHASNWHPLTWISHMLDVSLFGLDGGKHALVSVVWHAVNSVLLFFVLRRATRRTWPSAVVAALFALHPLHVESVAWISERKDVLSAFFFLLALWFYLGRRLWLTFAAFACALMAKPMAITFPFVLLLVDWWPLGRWSPFRTASPTPHSPTSRISARRSGRCTWRSSTRTARQCRRRWRSSRSSRSSPSPSSRCVSGSTSRSAGSGSSACSCRSSASCRSASSRWRTATPTCR